MANATVDDLDEAETQRNGYSHKLSSPASALWTMLVFLIIVGFVSAALYRQAAHAFQTNPGLNGFILAVLAVGVLLVFGQVLGLMREVRWFNSYRAAGSADKVGREPKLLAPMRSLIGGKRKIALSTTTLRSILDSIGTRLDESRDTSRYLIGLLVFLGLLGTFWGLIGTIGSISDVIAALDPGSNGSGDILSAIKSGLSQPLAGMGTAFSSSLLGLSGSLILGFLDLQAGRSQNRFYTELENWLASVTETGADLQAGAAGASTIASDDIKALTRELRKLTAAQAAAQAKVAGGAADGEANERSLAAMANLAEGIQGLVKNMRNEQQMLRDWIEAQQEEAKAMRRALDRLSDKIGSK